MRALVPLQMEGVKRCQMISLTLLWKTSTDASPLQHTPFLPFKITQRSRTQVLWVIFWRLEEVWNNVTVSLKKDANASGLWVDRQSNYPFSANVKSLHKWSQGINCRETLQQFLTFHFFFAVITTGNLLWPLSLRTHSFLAAEWCLWLSKKLFLPFFSVAQDVVMQQQSLMSRGNRTLL